MKDLAALHPFSVALEWKQEYFDRLFLSNENTTFRTKHGVFVSRPVIVIHLGQGRFFWNCEGPVGLIFGALGNPFLKQLHHLPHGPQ